MIPQNSADYVAFSILMIIFSVVVGNMIYEILLTQWVAKKENSCFESCCKVGELIED
jgi:hypothetical protein